MTDLRTAAQQALADLKDLHKNHNITYAGTISRLEAALAREQRDALLEALKTLVLATKDFSIGHYNEEVHDIALSKARAAIAKAEEA